jgi:hypothetical protein
MRDYNSVTDYQIMDGAVRAAYAFGTGIISAVKKELILNDITPPKNIDGIVFDIALRIDREEKEAFKNES